MFVQWLLDKMGKRKESSKAEVYPIVFSVDEDEAKLFLDWMKNHDCIFVRDKKTIFHSFTHEEIIKKGCISSIFEQYGYDGKKSEAAVSLILYPSVNGTVYKLKCKCGVEFDPRETQKIEEGE